MKFLLRSNRFIIGSCLLFILVIAGYEWYTNSLIQDERDSTVTVGGDFDSELQCTLDFQNKDWGRLWKITEVRTSCGCTKVEFDNGVIWPWKRKGVVVNVSPSTTATDQKITILLKYAKLGLFSTPVLIRKFQILVRRTVKYLPAHPEIDLGMIEYGIKHEPGKATIVTPGKKDVKLMADQEKGLRLEVFSLQDVHHVTADILDTHTHVIGPFLFKSLLKSPAGELEIPLIIKGEMTAPWKCVPSFIVSNGEDSLLDIVLNGSGSKKIRGIEIKGDTAFRYAVNESKNCGRIFIPGDFDWKGRPKEVIFEVIEEDGRRYGFSVPIYSVSVLK